MARSDRPGDKHGCFHLLRRNEELPATYSDGSGIGRRHRSHSVYDRRPGSPIRPQLAGGSRRLRTGTEHNRRKQPTRSLILCQNYPVRNALVDTLTTNSLEERRTSWNRSRSRREDRGYDNQTDQNACWVTSLAWPVCAATGVRSAAATLSSAAFLHSLSYIL